MLDPAMLRWLAVVAALAATAAAAAEHPIAGAVFRLSGHRLRFVAARQGAIAPAGDPRATGATLAITGLARSIPLRGPSWRVVGRDAYRYLDRTAGGGVRKIVFRPRTLVVSGGGLAVAGPQPAVEVRFQLGDDLYCARFARFVENRAGRVLARHAPAPAACSGGPTSLCGNGVLEPGEECDDGGAVAGDGCSPTCERELPCGNRMLDPGEACDDGNHRSGDGCSSTCQLEACAGIAGTPGTAIAKELVVSGLASPVHASAPRLDPSRLFVVEQTGRVRVVKDGVLLPDPFLDVSDRISCCGEQGLLSIAFHPAYATNGRFFVAYTNGAGDDVVARYQVGVDPDHADPASERIVITIPEFAANHNGGQLAFGPDGFLYFGLGDGGGADDPQETGQDLTTLLGKLLRLDVDLDAPLYYASPASNPFVGRTDARPEIWAFGLRNPWRFGFDRGTGDLYVGDVGQGAREEIDVQPAASPGGENYGWDVFEGTLCHEPTPPATMCPDPPLGFTMPVLEYDHAEGCAVTGGFVYRGCAMPDLRGTYFYADFCSGFVRTFRGVAGGVALDPADRTRDLGPGIDNPSSFGEDARGELYVTDYDGELWRIVPAP